MAAFTGKGIDVRITLIILELLVCFFIAGCSLYDIPGYGAFKLATPTFTDEPASSPTAVTPTPVCSFVENRHPVPEVTNRLLADFKAAGLAVDTIAVDAFGDDFIDPSSNKWRNFKVIQIDVQLEMDVPDITDRKNLGNLLAKILKVCEPYAQNDLKGTRSGDVFITFASGSLQTNLRFAMDHGLKALHQGLTGELLMNWFNPP
jgi:hypothetical protein